MAGQYAPLRRFTLHVLTSLGRLDCRGIGVRCCTRLCGLDSMARAKYFSLYTSTFLLALLLVEEVNKGISSHSNSRQRYTKRLPCFAMLQDRDRGNLLDRLEPIRHGRNSHPNVTDLD
jgi:hypothetical protein